MIDALIQVAEDRGYRVAWHRGGPKAVWRPASKTVSVRSGLDDVQALCALAHELGHAHYGDPPGHRWEHEDRANRFAAQLLISPVEYAAAELIYGPHPARLAHELGVTVTLIEAWRTLCPTNPQPIHRYA